MDLTLSPSSTVFDLVDPSTLQWNHNLIFFLFSPSCAHSILSLPATDGIGEDQPFWRPENSGVFTVKSASLLDPHPRFQPLTPCFSPPLNWKKLWALKIQARLKLLLWKLASSALPVHATLHFLATRVDENFFLCLLCNQEPESVEHLFLRCCFAQTLWRSARWPLDARNLHHLSIAEWISTLLNAASALLIRHPSERDFIL